MLVGPGKAGGQVVCDACGSVLAVPRLRDLQPFSAAEEARRVGRWRSSQGWLLIGVVVGVLAAAGAVLVPRLLTGGPARLPDEATIRAAIETVDAATVYKAWQAMRGSEIDRGTLPEESRLQRAADTAGRIAAALWAVAAAAAAIALAAAVGVFRGAKSAAGPGRRSAG